MTDSRNGMSDRDIIIKTKTLVEELSKKVSENIEITGERLNIHSERIKALELDKTKCVVHDEKIKNIEKSNAEYKTEIQKKLDKMPTTAKIIGWMVAILTLFGGIMELINGKG